MLSLRTLRCRFAPPFPKPLPPFPLPDIFSLSLCDSLFLKDCFVVFVFDGKMGEKVCGFILGEGVVVWPFDDGAIRVNLSVEGFGRWIFSDWISLVEI